MCAIMFPLLAEQRVLTRLRARQFMRTARLSFYGGKSALRPPVSSPPASERARRAWCVVSTRH